MTPTAWRFLNRHKGAKFSRVKPFGLEAMVVARGGGQVYWVRDEQFVMMFDVARYVKQDGRVVPDGLTHLGTLRGTHAAGLIRKIHRGLAAQEELPPDSANLGRRGRRVVRSPLQCR